MSPEGPSAPAGWYADGHGGQRYWDGRAWTSHAAPAPGAAMVPAAHGYGVTPYAQQMTVAPKSPALAALATFFIVGLGQLLNGEVGKGIMFFCAAFVSGLLCLVLIGFILLPVVWIWAIADAYSGAQRWNARHGIIS